MEQQLAIREQNDRNTLPPGSYNAASSHHRYPVPNMAPNTIKELKDILVAMRPYFYNFSVFVSLLNSDEDGRGPLGKIIERSFDRYNFPLFKSFSLDEWYRSLCNGPSSDVAHDGNIENFDRLLIDPVETYQGPKLLMPAGWNKIVSHFVPFFFVFITQFTH